MGTRSPIFKLAFWPSVARICGFCSNLLLLSFSMKLAVAPGMVSEISRSVILESVFRVGLLLVVLVVPVVVVLPVVVPVVVVVVPLKGTICALTLVGG